MNVMGIIFANNAAIGPLTDQRTMASIPFGGRYRQIDFALSNLSHAGVRHIGVIVRQRYQSLLNHIGSGEEWGLVLEEGGLEFLTPFSMSTKDTYRGKLESLYYAMNFLSFGPKDEYVIMVDTSVQSNLDLEQILQSHIESGKDLTVLAKAGIADGTRKLDLAIKMGADGAIADMAVDYVAPPEYLASMDIFILSKELLIRQVQELIAHNLYHMDRDFVLGLWQKGALSVNVCEYDGIAMYNESVEDYFRNSLSLTDLNMRHALFSGSHPVYTRVRDCVPSYYGENCSIENCIVADGCMLEGKAVNSVLFREVTICPGASVENCVIMNNTVVGEGAELCNVILDKDVTVRPGAKLFGTLKNPITVTRGEIV